MRAGTTLGHGARYIGYLNDRRYTAVQSVTVYEDLPLPPQGNGEDGIAIVGDDVVSMHGMAARVYDIPTARAIDSRVVCPNVDAGDTGLAGSDSRLIYASCGAGGAVGAAHRAEIYEVRGTSMRSSIDPGEQSCWRTRAKDAIGNVGPWSSWICVNAPFPAWGAYMDAASTGNFTVTVGSAAPASTTKAVAVRSVRVKVQTGPTFGAMKVYAGDEYLGTVNAYAARSGTKLVTLTTSSSTVKAVEVRFVATSHKYVKVKATHFVR